jgi:hypothetical protein
MFSNPLGILKGLLDLTLVKTYIAKGIRWFATWAAGIIIAFLVQQLTKHGFTITEAVQQNLDLVGAALVALLTALATLLFSLIDAKTVQAKVTIAAATGAEQGYNAGFAHGTQEGAVTQKNADQAKADAVANAMKAAGAVTATTAAANDNELARLRAGKA